jgi:YXWGXW repeat-containing protein
MVIRCLRSLLFGPLLLAIVTLALSAASYGQIGVSITVGPPPLPVYAQPLCPAPGYLWVPGYWAYDYDFGDYYWVPGTWVLPPEVGFLWTPGYWGWSDGRFVFTEGYWGPLVGFYGGINYGFGYFGEGFEGGRWEHGQFFYNRAVSNVNVTVVRNVYNTRVVNNTRVSRVSFNGGNGGIHARPTPAQERAAHERHIAPVSAQTQHVQAARANRELRASVNRGKPPVAATPKPGAMHDRGVVAARQAGGLYHPPANHAADQPRKSASARSQNERPPRQSTSTARRSDRPSSNAARQSERPQPERTTARKTGNPPRRENQQSQQQPRARHEQPKVQQRQEQEHPRIAQQRANDVRRPQTEQRHREQQAQPRQEREQHTKEQPARPERERSDHSKPPKEKPE